MACAHLTIAAMFFRYRRVSRYTLQICLSQPRKACGKGYRSSSCPLEGIALYGGIAEIVSSIAVNWATKLQKGVGEFVAPILEWEHFPN